MKNLFWAFTLSILVHFIILIGFSKIKIKDTNNKKETADKPKYTYVQLASIKQKIKKKEYKKVEKKEYKKVEKKDIKPAKRKTVFLKKKKKILRKKKVEDLREKYIKLYNEQQEIKKLDKLTQNYIKLYGQDYFKLSDDVKKYLKENLNIIGQITQQYLIYPSLAIRTKQHGMNIVEFILKPDGDISNLKIVGSSSYNTLDKNTIKTIKIAYKDYPRPQKDTLVKIYVKYLLY